MTVSVFCGSSFNPAYKEITAQVAQKLVAKGQTIVCGGSSEGLMGVLAETALAAGGKVIGVLELALFRKENSLPSLYLVENPSERKQTMSILASCFLLLPGGLGSLEEFFDIWSEVRLHLHNKPIAILNTAGYYTPLLGLIDHMIKEGFITSAQKAQLQVFETLDELDNFIP